jgi:alpha-tubulin suppressor-like RCC1 family protein/endo-1,4-beta-mannosidase
MPRAKSRFSGARRSAVRLAAAAFATLLIAGFALVPAANAEFGSGSRPSARGVNDGGGAPPAPPTSGSGSLFVTRSGQTLMVGTQPFRFTGFNVYQANSGSGPNACGGDLVDGTGLDTALSSMGPGVSAIRAWFFQSFVTDANGQRDWSAFDHTIAVAQAHGIRVIATLANQWPDCEPLAGYKTQDWYTSGYLDKDPGGSTSYFQFVQDVAARYASNPTILAWQLMNEAEVLPSEGAACPQGTDQPADILHDWAANVSAAIKAVDPNHLISLGTIGSGQCGAQGDEYEHVHDIPTIDLCEFHDDGNPVAAFPGDQYNGLPRRVQQCADLDKPLILGEVGMPRNLTGSASDPANLDGRAISFWAKLTADHEHGIAGALLWNWANNPGDPTSWDIGPGDPVLTSGALDRWAGTDLLAWGLGGNNPSGDLPAQVPGLGTIASVAAGQSYVLAVGSDGSAWAWGANGSGQLGLGTTTDTPTPTRVAALPPVIKLAGDVGTSLALDADGTVQAWGSNSAGQLGDGTTTSRSTPALVPGLSDVTDIAVGQSFGLALTADGQVWSWGAGLSAGGSQPSPAPVPGLSHVIAISAGLTLAVAVDASGTVWTWGRAIHGELGLGGPTNSSDTIFSPTAVPGLPPVVEVDAGDAHTLALAADGSVWAWGWNADGELGDGSTTDRSTPAAVAGVGSAVDVSAGGHHSLAVLSDGTVSGWGLEAFGELGPGLVGDPVTAPTILHGLSVRHVALVAAGELSSFALAAPLPAGTTVPDAPTNVRPVGSDGSALIQITLPAADGGSPITSYTAVASPGGQTLTVPADDLTGLGMTGLTNGTDYTFTVYATNDIGNSPPSDPSYSVRVAGSPGQPTGLAATPGNRQASLTWTAPSSNGGSPITSYYVTTFPGATTVATGGAGTSYLATGLVNGTSYTFTVRAGNQNSSGPASAASSPVIPLGPPAAPTGVAATAGIAKAVVSWTAPVDTGGTAITGYTVTASPGGAHTSTGATVTTGTVTGLTNGTTYTFTVTAKNAIGTGPASSLSNPVTPAPQNQTITFTTIPNQKMDAGSVSASATASSGLTVTFGTASPGICSSSGTNGATITLVTPGSCSVTASQAGNATYNPVSKTQAFTISLATQTISFTTIGAQKMTAGTVTAAATASSGLAVTFSASASGVCASGSGNGAVITLLGPGSCPVTASQAGSSIYAAVSKTQTFSISLAAQIITFANPGTTPIVPSPLIVSGTSTSGLPVVFTTTTPTICTAAGLQGTQIALLAIGSCTVSATQPGSSIYAPAAVVNRPFSIIQASQAITFGTLPTASLLQGSITVSASAGSGLPVSFTSSTASVCGSSGPTGATISLLKTGTCRIVASQAGNAIYKAAPNVAQTFTVVSGKLSQSISFSLASTRTLALAPETLTASATSGLPVSFISTTPSVCTVTGPIATLQYAGSCTISASQSGNSIYLAAPAISHAQTVSASGFVEAAGTGLTLNSQPFKIFGASIYETSNYGHVADASQVYGWAQQAHLNTLRLTDIFNENTTDSNAPYSETDWDRIDSLIAQASQDNIHVVLDLSSFRNWFVNSHIALNGWQTACSPNQSRDPVNFATVDPYDPSVRPAWTTFMTWVANRTNTVTGIPYRNDPTILVVSIAGEPLGNGSAECGKAASAAELTDFYAWALAEWKSLDANHLRSNGGLTGTYAGLDGQGNPIPSGLQIDGVAIFQLADNTLPSLHTYPPANTLNDGQTPVLGPVAQAANKPWFAEEFGWQQSYGDDVRAANYQWLYDEGATYGSAGSMFWNLGPEASGDGTFDVNPSTPLTWATVLRNAP